MDRAKNSLKYIALQKRHFYQKAQKLQKNSSRVIPKHKKDAEILHPWKAWTQKLRMAFFPRNSQLTLQPPPPGGGVLHMMSYTGRLRPERGIFLWRANRTPKVATCEAWQQNLNFN